MQTQRKLTARILSLAMSAALVGTMLSAAVFAEEAAASTPGTIGVVQSFDKLPERFTPSVGENAPAHVYALSVGLGTPAEELQLPDGLSAMVERTPEGAVVDSGAATATKETVWVTWQSDKEYKSDANGKFVYTAVLQEGFTLARGVQLPQIYVMVGRQARAGGASDEIIAQRTKAIDFTATSIEKQADTSSWGNPTTTDIDALATEGWKWEYQTLKLTLNGLNAKIEGDVGETFAYLTLPAGATIVLADESINTIDGTVVVTGYQKMAMGIRCGGTFTVSGNGSLSVTAPECHATSTVANSYGVNSVGMIIGGSGSNPTVTCIGGKATATIADSLARSLGIFSVVDVNGGTLTAKAGTSVGPTTEMSGIGISSIADSNYIKVTAGSLLIQGATRAVTLSYKKEFDPAIHIVKGDTADDVNDPTGNATWSGALSRSYTFMINGDVAKSVKITAVGGSGGGSTDEPTQPKDPILPSKSGGKGSGTGLAAALKSVTDKTINTTEGSKNASNVVRDAIQNALATGTNAVSARASFRNFTALAADGLKTINSIAAKEAAGKAVDFKVNFDQVAGGMVASRISVNPAELAKVMDKTLPLGVYFNQQKDKQVTEASKAFAQQYSNKAVIVSFEQKTPLGVNAELAIQLDLSGLNTKTLYFYSHDPVKNTYTRIAAPGYWKDSVGYAHFTAPLGGNVVITDAPLAQK